MPFSQSEPQVVHETDEYAVIHNHPFRSGHESVPVYTPRGVRPSDTVMPIGRGRGLQFGRGRALGRGAALLQLMQRRVPHMPIVGGSPSSSRESSLEREMPFLEPAERFIFDDVKRNWG